MGRRIVKAGGDGDCLFHALDGRALRFDVANFMTAQALTEPGFQQEMQDEAAKLRAGRWGGHTAIATYSPSECVPVCLRKLCKKLSSFLLFCSACRVLVLICSFLFCGGRCATKARMASASITDREFLYKKCNKRCSYLVNEVGIKEVNNKTK